MILWSCGTSRSPKWEVMVSTLIIIIIIIWFCRKLSKSHIAFIILKIIPYFKSYFVLLLYWILSKLIIMCTLSKLIFYITRKILLLNLQHNQNFIAIVAQNVKAHQNLDVDIRKFENDKRTDKIIIGPNS